MINRGESPIIEEGMTELIKTMVGEKRLHATNSPAEAVSQSEISLVCVGTPSKANGSLDLKYVKSVCQEIGTTLEVYSGKKHGRDFQVCINPEFLREGTSIKGFYSPPFTLIGADDDEVARSVRRLYSDIKAPLFVVPVKAAEMVKYACNSFHGLKVSFANEIGNICKGLGIDSHQVMEVFCQDTKLNLSPY